MDLQDALQRLPEHEPQPDLWARIEADLRADALIDRTISQLPDADPQVDGWPKIQSRLEPNTEPRVMPLFPPSVWLRVAAVVALTIGLGLLAYYGFPDEQVRISYATQPMEKQPLLDGTVTELAVDRQAEQFIDQQCEQQRAVCRKPEVAELKQDLAELNSQKARIEAQLQVFGNDAMLVQAQIKVENGRAEIMKELVRILTQ